MQKVGSTNFEKGYCTRVTNEMVIEYVVHPGEFKVCKAAVD